MTFCIKKYMKNRSQIFVATVVLAILIAISMVFITKHRCGSDDEQQRAFEQTLDRAINGDTAAAETLYRDYLAAGRIEQARYWALMGAIDGSPGLITAYSSLRVAAPSFDTTGENTIIRKNLSKEGAKRLATSFDINKQD